MAPSLEGRPIDTKEAQSEVRLSLVDTNPVYFSVPGIIFVHLVLLIKSIQMLLYF